MDTLHLRLLGEFRATLGERALPTFSTDKTRALLAYLAVERGRPQRRDRLTGLFWPDQTEKLAKQSLRQALSNLRQVLGEAAEILVAGPQDVLIPEDAPLQADATELLALVTACRNHRHARLERCLPCLQRQSAIADLYAGEFLAGFSLPENTLFEEWLMLTRETLHREAVQAVGRLSAFRERSGDRRGAIDFARRLTRMAPWHEEAHRRLMALLAAEGARSEALVQYKHCQQALLTELGLPPSAETTALMERIRDGAFSPPAVVPQAPQDSSTFVGRKKELTELAGLLADPDCRLLTILGPGGMGKTRLALQLAQSFRGVHADGIFFVPLADKGTLESGLLAVADSLGMDPIPGGQILDHLRDILRRKELLLLLDNVEHLVDECDGLATLLIDAPGVQILATSRERLRLREEWVYGLDGLAVPPQAEDLVHAEDYDAVRLFLRRARQADQRFAVSSNNIADIASICRLVEGFPLGVELASAAAGEKTCAEIAAGLRRNLDLSASYRDLPARHRSLRAAFEHSWSLLSESERRMLADLSVFAGGIEPVLGAEVAGADSADLERLASKSLIRFEPERRRYGFHELIRSFAAVKLAGDPPRRRRLIQSHIDAFTRIVHRLHPQLEGADPKSALHALIPHAANLQTAWDYAWEQPHPERTLMGLLPALAAVYALHGPVAEGEDRFRRGLEQSLEIGLEAAAFRLLLLRETAHLCSLQAKHDQAVADAEAAIRLALEPEDKVRTTHLLGQILFEAGRWDDARTALEESLTLARASGMRTLEADSLRGLGDVANGRTDFLCSISHFEAALSLARQLGDRGRESDVLIGLGSAEWDLGRLAAARGHLESGLALKRTLGDRTGEAKAFNNLANLAAAEGDLAASIRYSEQALSLHRNIGSRNGQSAALNNLGCTYWCLGEYRKARLYYQQAFDLHRLSGNRQAQGEALGNLMLAADQEGDIAEAGRIFRLAWSLSEETGDRGNLANLSLFHGRILSAQGKYHEAESFFQQSLEFRSGETNPGRRCEVLAELAFAHHRQGKSAAAEAVWQAVLAAIDSDPELPGADEPFRAYRVLLDILAEREHPRARELLVLAADQIRRRAALIADPRLRTSFLDNVPDHSAILSQLPPDPPQPQE